MRDLETIGYDTERELEEIAFEVKRTAVLCNMLSLSSDLTQGAGIPTGESFNESVLSIGEHLERIADELYERAKAEISSMSGGE